jgi:hypothetical protein
MEFQDLAGFFYGVLVKQSDLWRNHRLSRGTPCSPTRLTARLPTASRPSAGWLVYAVYILPPLSIFLLGTLGFVEFLLGVEKSVVVNTTRT